MDLAGQIVTGFPGQVDLAGQIATGKHITFLVAKSIWLSGLGLTGFHFPYFIATVFQKPITF